MRSTGVSGRMPVGAGTITKPVPSNALMERRIWNASVTSNTLFTPSALSTSAEYFAFSNVLSDLSSTHRTGTWKDCSKSFARIRPRDWGSRLGRPPETRIGRPVCRCRCAAYRRRYKLRKPEDGLPNSGVNVLAEALKTTMASAFTCATSLGVRVGTSSTNLINLALTRSMDRR